MTLRLRTYTDADLDMTLEIETDPVTMRELGGPRDEAAIRDVHVRRLREPWWFVIADDDGTGLGTIGVWEAEHHGEVIHETGWTVRTAARGKGVGSGGLAALLHRIRAADAFASIHAFPGVTNVPSNRLCEKFGFRDLGEEDVDFAGRTLRCNHWSLTLRETPLQQR